MQGKFRVYIFRAPSQVGKEKILDKLIDASDQIVDCADVGEHFILGGGLQLV